MKITSTSSEEFRKDNQILYSAKVIHTRYVNDGRVSEAPSRKNVFSGLDVLDLNHNGRVEKLLDDEYPAAYLSEPALYDPINQQQDDGFGEHDNYNHIKKFGLSNKTEVVTQDDIKSSNDKYVKHIKIADMSAGSSDAGYSYELSEHARPISSLIHKVGVKNKDAKWGFDLARDEFIIYEPKK
ncbi:MAG: hypothetical protein M1536_06720 [Firmicutes bacterium]|nr:hypothetical protein [Bacillota bacterium]